MLVTYPFSPTSDRARARDFSSRVSALPAVVTNRGVRAVFSPAMTALARFSCRGQRLGVPGRTLRAVGPHRPPRPSVPGGVPGRFGLDLRVVLGTPATMAWGDRVDDLPVGERVAVPAEVRLQVLGGLGDPRADDELQPGLVELAQVGRREHPGVGDHHQALEGVPVLEGPDDRQQREGLGLVALEAADLEGEPAPVDQQPDHDLGVHAAFLGVADLAQLVLVLGLEVQRGHVVQHQGQIPGHRGVRVAGCGERVPVPALLGPGQRPEHGPQRGMLDADLVQHPDRVGLARGLDDPGQHQLLERLIGDGVEPEPVVHPLEHPPQQRRALPRDHSRPTRRWRAVDAQVQHPLTGP